MRLLLAPFVFVVGCAAAPPPPVACAKPASIAKICDVDKLAKIPADTGPFEIAAARTAWISQNIDDPEAVELRVRISTLGADEQAKRLRDSAKGAGLASCALADTLEATGVGGLAP